MTTIPEKQNLVEVVKEWVNIDNKIIHLNKLLKELRQEKKKINQEMIGTMKKNEIDIFDIKDGQIQYKLETKKETLSQKKFLVQSMKE